MSHWSQTFRARRHLRSVWRQPEIFQLWTTGIFWNKHNSHNKFSYHRPLILSDGYMKYYRILCLKTFKMMHVDSRILTSGGYGRHDIWIEYWDDDRWSRLYNCVTSLVSIWPMTTSREESVKTRARVEKEESLNIIMLEEGRIFFISREWKTRDRG